MKRREFGRSAGLASLAVPCGLETGLARRQAFYRGSEESARRFVEMDIKR